MIASKIFDCQQRIADLLNADAFFNDPDESKKLLAITQRKGNIQSEVQQKLLKIGAGVIVMLPLVTFEGAESRISLGMKFGIVVTENPIVNQGSSGTQKPAESIVEKVCQLIHWKPNSAAVPPRNVATLYQLDRNAVRMMETPPGTQLLNYIVAVNTSITL
jgi:hypothetical protein